MVTSNQKQLFQENNFIRSLSKFNNVIISYCLKNDKEEYYPSLLIEKYNGISPNLINSNNSLITSDL